MLNRENEANSEATIYLDVLKKDKDANMRIYPLPLCVSRKSGIYRYSLFQQINQGRGHVYKIKFLGPSVWLHCVLRSFLHNTL